MAEDPKITFSGTAYRYGTEERITKAVLRATKEDLPEVKEWTDEDGNFKFSGLEPGTWNIEVLHGESRPQKIEVELKENKSTFRIDLFHLMNTEDKVAGGRFFNGLISILIALFLLYIYLHTSLPQAKGPLSGILVESISKTEAHVNDIRTLSAELGTTITKIDKVINNNPGIKHLGEKYINPIQNAIEAGKEDEILKLLESLKSAAPQELETLVTQAKEEAGKVKQLNEDSDLNAAITKIDTTLKKALEANSRLVSADKKLIAEHIRNIQDSLKTNNSKAVLSELKELRQNIESPPIQGFVPWTGIPWRFLEVLFWALAGVLTHYIITSGYYLRSNRFYREGIRMHLSLIVTIPLMVLVAMLLLSLVSFEFKLSDDGTPVKFDLSDPSILAAFSFILAVRPWAIWEFIRSAGERITGQKNDKQKE